tara:strand:+ start:443 stop:1708 length:1266 start_codon:yes stop_codon:yes gene_type:complete
MALSNPYFTDDKRLKLYKRKYTAPHQRAGQFNPVWRAKIKLARGVPAQDFSTHQRNGNEALKYATRRLDELTAQHAVGMDISVKLFHEVSRLLLVEMKNDLRQGKISEEKYGKYNRDIHSILNPHFGTDEITKITSNDISTFFDIQSKRTFRRNGRVESISSSTLTKYASTLRAVFRKGVVNGYISGIPFIPSFKTDQYIREGLNADEWRTLHEYLINDFVGELDDSTIYETDQTVPKYYRQAFVDFFQLVVFTGLRRTECLKLRWNDWTLDYEDGVRIGRIHVRAVEKGARKTKKPRIFKITDRANKLLEKRKSIAHYVEPDDYIFAHPRFARESWRRKNIATMRNTFEKSLDACGLLFDSNGNKRTIYIGRHTHAHLTRNAGKPIDDIADDIGNLTSTAQRFYIGTNTGNRKGLPVDIE